MVTLKANGKVSNRKRKDAFMKNVIPSAMLLKSNWRGVHQNYVQAFCRVMLDTLHMNKGERDKKRCRLYFMALGNYLYIMLWRKKPFENMQKKHLRILQAEISQMSSKNSSDNAQSGERSNVTEVQ